MKTRTIAIMLMLLAGVLMSLCLAPFKAVLDGTFLMAAREGKVNIREQLPKYLCDKVPSLPISTE